MVDRREIREGAGLEEARLNQDFIEFLRRWSTPILVVIALVAVSYAGYTKWNERVKARMNDAYAEFERVAGATNASPDSLQRIADEYQDVGSISLLSRLQAADIYLRAVRLGMKPGATVDASGAIANKDDALTAEDRTLFLTKAHQLYTQVIEEAAKDNTRKLLQIDAMYGLAAVAECREDFDAARTQYLTIITVAKDSPYPQHASVAQLRIDSLDQLKQAPKLYATAELPAEAVAPLAPWQQPPPAASSGTPAPEAVPSPAGPPVPEAGPAAPTSTDPPTDSATPEQPASTPEPAPAPPADPK